MITYILIFTRALWWLLVLPHRKKMEKLWATYEAGGIKLCWIRAVERFQRKDYPYDHRQNQLSPGQSKHILAKCHTKPLFSIVVPVYKVAPAWLEKCICSVVNQYYTNWELVLVDDASQRDDLKQLINNWVSRDHRIHAYYLDQNLGIASATNLGIKESKGKFIGFLDHDDELTPDALTWVTWALNKNPKALWFYSDEDKVSPKGLCHSPYFKPDYSLEMLLSNMYTCHFSVYSAEVLTKVGGLRDGFDGSQDHDLALRLSEIIPKEKIIHISRVLYHWRVIPSSTAMSAAAKPKASSSGRKAVANALKMRNLEGSVTSHNICPTLYQIKFEPSEFPKVSIIIPTKNALALTKKCICSARRYTDYPNFEIVVLDNASDDPEFLKYLEKEQSDNRVKVIHYKKVFNHSEMNNIAAAYVDSEFVLFMNNDIEIISEKWLEQLVATAHIDKAIAVVGGLLLYPDRRVQHGGIILGLYGTAAHAHKYTYSELTGYFSRLHSLQEMSGITAALALVRRSSFEHIGGFNSNRYPTSYNDVDLCIRLRKEKYRCIYNPMVRAIHYESKTRTIDPKEALYRQRLVDDYSEILNHDPFYNPNLALDNEQFRGFRSFPVEEQIPELADYPKGVL